MPQGAPGPYPAVVLIAGSGPGQRNESTLYTAFNFYVCYLFLSPLSVPTFILVHLGLVYTLLSLSY